MNHPKRVALYGTGGHADVITEICDSLGIQVAKVFDDDPNKVENNGLVHPGFRLAGDAALEGVDSPFIVSVGDNTVRKGISQRIEQPFGILIHPSATVSESVSIGEGTVVVHRAIIQAKAKIGRHVIINTTSSIDHDCVIEDYAHVSPNCTLCGNVHVGEGTHIGAGATIIPNIKIGKWCKIGAGSVIINDVPDFSVVVGSPGRKVKSLTPVGNRRRETNKLLLIFGDKTADEIIPIAVAQHTNDFTKIKKQYFDDSTWDDPEFKKMVASHDAVYFIIGVVETPLRMKIQRLSEEAGFVPFSVIHRSAYIAKTAKIGVGCFIGPQAVVSENAVIGDFSIVHIHASFGHDSVCGSHCAILPGARVSGQASLGNGVLVGTNAAIFQNVRVGDYTQIDAMTYVHVDVPDEHLVSSRLPKPIKRLNFRK